MTKTKKARRAKKCVVGGTVCGGPYAASDGKTFVCYECAVYHDEHPRKSCGCEDCKS